MELSIIVPVYNVEKYLPKCIESILGQTINDFELILIDDGSEDQSGYICDEYAARDLRIKVIHQKNSGVSCARNSGLEIAKGQFVTFVDSDDWIEPSMYETMINIAKEKTVDVVACGISHYSEEGKYIFSELTDENELDHISLMNSIYSMPNPIGGCIWNKIYKRSKISDVRYAEGVSMLEDRMFLFDTFLYCENGYKISSTFYNVNERSTSATHCKSVKVPYDMIMGSHILMKKAKSYSKELYVKAMDKFLDDCLVHLPRIISIGKSEHKRFSYELIKIEALMSMTIVKTWFTGSLSRSKIHGYIFELIKLNRGCWI